MGASSSILIHRLLLCPQCLNLKRTQTSRRPFRAGPTQDEDDLDLLLRDLPPLALEDEEDDEEALNLSVELVPEAVEDARRPPGERLDPPNNEDVPVGARLSHFAPAWAHLFGQDSRPARTVREGVGLHFKSRPSLTRHPVVFATHSSLDGLKRAASLLEQKKVIAPVRDRSSLGFYSRLFLVPKRTGEDRPVIDLSPLNRQLDVPSFKMETQASVREAIRPGEWVTTIDIKDAYLHVPMATTTQRYLRFRVGSQVYQFRSLPFGLSTSPREFTKLLQPIVQLLRAHGVVLHAYLDDWLIRANSPQQARRDAYLVANVLQSLGWIVNQPKSCFNPSQDFVFLGMRFVTSSHSVRVHPSDDLRARLSLRLDRLARNPELTARELTSLFGLLQYLAPLVPQGRMRLRPIQWTFKRLWSQNTGSWRDRLVLSRSILRDLQWWISVEAFSGVPTVKPEASLTLFTDASTTGWGAIVKNHSASGAWNAQTAQRHINCLEIQAVLQALKALHDVLAGKVVRLMIDNRTAVAYIRNVGGIRSKSLNDLAIKVHKLALRMNTTLLPVFIPGSRNVSADALSRRGQIQESEWTLDQTVLDSVFQSWGQPWLDLFATKHNRRLSQFVCPFLDEQAYDVDALALSWKDLGLVYAFPPPKSIPEVIRKFSNSSGTQMILIAPLRVSSSWTPELMQMARAKISLGKHHQLLSQVVHGQGRIFHKYPGCFKLHAWLL